MASEHEGCALLTGSTHHLYMVVWNNIQQHSLSLTLHYMTRNVSSSERSSNSPYSSLCLNTIVFTMWTSFTSWWMIQSPLWNQKLR